MGFLDNLKGSLSQGADRVKFEAEKLQKTNRIRSEIGDLQTQIATNFGMLGQRAYELQKQGQINVAEIGSLTQMIDDLQTRLQSLSQELEQAQVEQFQPQPQPMQQPSYPAQSVPIDQQPQYPAPVPSAPPPATAGGACPSCGTALSPDSAFCPNCGTRVEA